MSMRVDLQGLLQKEMDRRDFLKHIGIGFVALTGVAALLKTMNSLGTPKALGGYGSSIYGGVKRDR